MGSSSDKYYKVEKRVIISRNSDYSDPIHDYTYTDKATITRHMANEVLAVTGGLTYDLAPMGTIKDCIISNLDDTNYVDVTFRNTANSATDNKVRILAGKSVNLGDTITPGNDLVLTADTADCECRIEVVGTV